MTPPRGTICVLHILSDTAIGGGGRYVFDLARHSGPRFRHVVALPSKSPLADFLQSAGLSVEMIDIRRRASLRGLRDIRGCARRWGADIVHTHGYRANFYGRLAFLRAPIKIVTTVHVSLFDYNDTSSLLRRAYILAERLLAFRTDRFICISKAMKEDAIRLGAAPERALLIPNGVDTSRFYPRAASDLLRRNLGIQGAQPVIGTVGRFAPEKGHAYLLDSLSPLIARWPDLRCLFVGDGPCRENLQSRTDHLGLAPHCVSTGVRSDVEGIYPLLDVFILPSPREPFGLVLLEAMASGIPVIATAAGGPLDFIQNGWNGLLVPPRDSNALSNAIESLLTDPTLARRLAENGKSTAEGEYRIERTAGKTAALYLELLHEGGKGWRQPTRTPVKDVET